MKKYTVSEFAYKIRDKYPKIYDDLTDSKLVELWLNKNPQDSPLIKKETWGCGWYLFLLFALWFGLTVYNVKIDKINFINSINRDIFGNNPKFINNPINENDYSNSDIVINELESNDNEETYYDFELTQDSRDFLNNSPIIKVLKLDENTTNTLLAILSDPNPDPDNREGEFCDNTSTRCLYCNDLVPGKSNSYKNFIESELICGEYLSGVYSTNCGAASLLNDNDLDVDKMSKIIEDNSNENTNIEKSKSIEDQLNSIDWKKVMGDGIFESCQKQLTELRILLKRVSSDYRNGKRYICVENPITTYTANGNINFCSEKCKSEYNYSR